MVEPEEHFGYANQAELLTEFATYMRDPKKVEAASNYLLDSLVDEMILGAAFEVHHALKTGSTAAMEGEMDESQNFKFHLIDMPQGVDVFGTSSAKKVIDCTCPNCDRLVAASRFAPHLEKCMGMGRATRVASRRIASSREGNNFYATTISDDEDDTDWERKEEKKKKKLVSVRPNGTKKNGKCT